MLACRIALLSILLSMVAAVTLRAVPIALDATNPVNRSNGTVRIVLSGENGVQYFVRSTTNLTNNEWQLAQSNGIAGNQTVNVPLIDPSAAQAFFRAESAYEQRSRLFISNYQRQLATGGPAVLSVNGANVQNTITIAEDRTNNQIVITGNGVPNYTPTVVGLNVTDGWNAPVSGGFQAIKFSENNGGAGGGNNPNRIVVATETFRIPLDPVINTAPTDTALGTVGVAINGLPIYNPFEDANQTAATGRIFSGCCGHPQLSGTYHYHKYPTCLKLLKGDVWQSEKDKCDEIDALVASGGHSPLIGFASDGWPVYGPVGWKDTNKQSKLLKSSYTGANDSYGNPTYAAGSGDLDECNGLVSPTPEYPEGIYHYVMTLEAGTDGTVKREISPYFGYDIRSTLKKHYLMPSGWTNDTTYINALKSGFTVNGANIAGTDTASFTTFYQFVTNMIGMLDANGLSHVAAEFETMKISYPFTIRKYRGTPAGAGGGGGMSGNITAVSPNSGASGQTVNLTITLNAAATPPLPPANVVPSSVTVGITQLTGVQRPNTTTVTGTLNLASATAGPRTVTVNFSGPPGQPAPSYAATNAFTVTTP